MNIKTLAYAALTPKERFQLIVAAGARGDQPEQDRVRCSGHSIKLSVSDHTPWAHAFHELATMVFLEMLEEAAKHRQVFERFSEAEELLHTEDETDGDEWPDEDDADLEASDEPSDVEPTNDNEWLSDHWHHFYLAQGFILRTKLAGWRLFCERLHLPPFAAWQLLPGFERLQIAMALVEDNEYRSAPVFETKGMLRWLNRIRPKGEPKPTAESLISPEGIADGLEQALHDRAAWWGG